jgi:drug/metabolite transporter (DMT)-like permease
VNAYVGLGILVAALATTSYNVGLIVEKRALGAMPPIDARRAVSLVRTLVFDPVWLAGFALMLCGFGLQVVALMLAPVSVVQPVLGSGVVILVLLSRLVLRERLGRVELWCVLAVAVAIAAIALSAAGSAGRVGHQASGLWMTAVAVPACLLALILGASALRPVSGGKHRVPAVGVSYGVAAGLLYGVATLAIKGLSGAIFHHGGGLSGLVVAVLTSPYPYLTVGCSGVALLIFQTGLQRCRVAIVGPVSNITGSIFFMVAGTWLFGEQLPANPVELALRLGGILLAGAAVVVLSRQPAGPAPEGVRTARPDPSTKVERTAHVDRAPAA